MKYNLQQPDFNVNSFAQDQDGYVWMATSHGLSRFNGSGYMTWNATDEDGGLSNDNVMSLLFDDEGRLWLGTECGLGYLENGVYRHNGEAVYNPISAVKELGKDHLIALGKDGFVRMRKDGLAADAVYYSIGTSWLEDVLVTGKGEVWFAANSNDSTYLYVLDSGLKKKVSVFLGKNLDVAGMCELPSGDVYLATDRRVTVLDAVTGVVSEVPALNSILGGAGKIHFILPYRGNQILVGIAGKGFFAYVPEDGTVRHIIRQQTLSADSYVCFVDRDDRIWLSDKQNPVRTYNPKGVYVHFNPQGEDRVGEVSHLYFDNEGFLWMNMNGQICSMDSLTGEVVGFMDDSESCRASFIDSKGRLWAVFGQNDVKRYALRGGMARLEKNFVFNEGVFSISEGKDGRIWLSSVRKVFVIDDADEVETFRPSGAPAFTLLLSDRRTRRVFMFTVNDGLYEMHGDASVSRVETGDVKGISYVMTASDGALWMGTYNEGVVRYDEKSGSLVKIGKEQGLPDLSIRSIVEDVKGDIWFTTRTNIVKYDSSLGTVSVVHDDWYVDGRMYSLVSGVTGPDGMLFFGGNAGITRVDPSIPFPEPDEKPLNLEQVFVGGRPVEFSKEGLTLNHDDGMVQFRFAGQDYDSGPFLAYSYMLEGHDRNWTYVYGDGVAVYNHLSPGSYMFKVRLKTADGNWSSGEIDIPVRVSREPVSMLAVFLVILSLALVSVLFIFLKKRRAVVVTEAAEEVQEEQVWYDTASLGDSDKAFLDKVAALIEENLDSDKYSVNELARNLGMSYSSLYAKVKALTGGTPQYFISAYRMKKAETLLKSGSFSVSEVSYKVGSSSPMTFSREFKKFFGYPPSTLLK